MRIRVELPEQSDVDAHTAANARGEVPDRTPYGLHHLGEADDVELEFRRPLTGRTAWLARKVRNRLDGYEPVAELAGAVGRRRADVVFTMDERTGFPAALLPGGPPVVSGLVWVQGPERYPRAARPVVGKALDRLAGIVTLNPGLYDDLVHGWGLDPAKVHPCRFGIDTEFFGVRPWSEATPLVAGVGDDEDRDHPLLVEAVSRLAGRREVRLEIGTTMAGVEIPEHLGVVHRRRMEGAVRAMYGRSSVVALALHPTTRGAGSTVVLEAAASGRPVVATRTAAMEALIDPSRGILVDPEDADALADAIGSLLDDPDRARAMGETARAWVTEHHSSAQMAADFRDVMRDVVRRRR
ncbi:glycosyltransferase family 4 protein [Actinomycetospora termitidis]|uniref:Glycosyltransferase family 4 protein n=1 Tax=Actinomycetospora termitidis TaxID=3053470 RepID=A0ABT7MHI2_9PSEU|nr:glycosyltransferase family 4 protein [Actinomycetospora sp. Odt1-22]MDL5159896.1 glycosyltransferase family 4 protein [Actinomycetospora sp. Odt1-22]